jgi:ATP-dependent RNA helicase DDX23/PRP28
VLAAGEDVHWSDKRLRDMTDRDWRILREDFDIHFKGKKPPRPLRSWAEAGLHGSLMRAIDEMGYKEPSPIQRATVAAGMEHRDLMGIAETGSGKTAAFLLPMLHIILSGDPARRAACKDHGPLALILAPTRELAQQIEAETAKLCKFARVTSTCVVGGENIDEQAQTLRNGVEVLVATPGRLVECLQASLLVFNQCNYVVLDEADTMIDFGFEPQVTQILEVMASHGGSSAPAKAAPTEAAVQAASSSSSSSPSVAVPAGSSSASASASLSSSSSSSSSSAPVAESERTTIMFSATMPPAVERIALRFMSNTLKVRIGDDDSVKNRRISQEVIYTAENGKRKLLAAALRRGLRPAIVFVNTKKNCDTVARNITDLGSSCIVLHGDKEQADRATALADFKAGRVEVLVATDVAGRGLDIPDVAQVINYDLPSDIQRYTHRIGRTGRAGKDGASVSFFTDDDEKILPSLRSHLLATGQAVPVQLDRHPAVAASALG